MAIDPVLQRLKGLLEDALAAVETAQDRFQQTTNYSDTERDLVIEAKDYLRQSESAISELNSKTSGTAYAFIGLQLSSIGTQHIEPANESLGAITAETLETIADNLNNGRFHIERALALLNALDKSYEAAKREEKIAESMQRLSKMHQLFLENSQKL